MRLTITDTTEPAPNGDGTWTGYYSVEIEAYGELLADVNVAPEVLPDFEEPQDLRDLAASLQQAAEMWEDSDHV